MKKNIEKSGYLSVKHEHILKGEPGRLSKCYEIGAPLGKHWHERGLLINPVHYNYKEPLQIAASPSAGLADTADPHVSLSRRCAAKPCWRLISERLQLLPSAE